MNLLERCGKDRVVMLPQSLLAAPHFQAQAACMKWDAYRTAEREGMGVPHAPKVAASGTVSPLDSM